MTDSAAAPTSREGLVRVAIQQWVNSLVDLGGRNNLLYYRDLKVGTLSLDEAVPAALGRLHAGQSVQLSHLFPRSLTLLPPVKNARTIRSKIQELDEERGIRAGYLAVGLATWTDEVRDRNPQAPILLRSVSIEPIGGAQDDFVLTLADEVEINPVLLHVLRTQHSVQIDEEEITGLIDLSALFDPTLAYSLLSKACQDIPGFAVTDRQLIGTFSYAKLPMVTDLQDHPELLAASDLVAAIAGDPNAARAVRGTLTGADFADMAYTPPRDEFLVLDADSSQSVAINAVVSGQSLVVKGPPGTGKSQTISNLISTLVARGQTVLFVAEKRAAIEAVLKRLDHVGLGDLTLDLHDGAGNRRRIAESLAAALEQSGRVLPPVVADIHESLEVSARALTEHDAVVNSLLEPWGVSVFDAQAAVLATPPQCLSSTRFRGQALGVLSGSVVSDVRRILPEFAALGGLRPPGDSPWSQAVITSSAEAEQALAVATRVAASSLPATREQLMVVLRDTGLREPTTLEEWRAIFGLLDGVRATLGVMAPQVFQENLAMLAAATGPSSFGKQLNIKLGYFDRRRAVKQARALWIGQDKPSKARLHEVLVAAWGQLGTWMTLSADQYAPRLPGNLGGAEQAYASLSADLQALGAHLATTGLMDQSPDALELRAQHLVADVVTLQRLPRLHELRTWLHSVGLDGLCAELRANAIPDELVVQVFDDAWYRSIIEHVGLTNATFGAFNGRSQSELVQRFEQADIRHLSSTPARVRRAAAECLVQVLNQHDDQARLIRAEANKRQRHKPLRELWKLAPDALLAAKPCWAMSPLVVSQVLPAKQLFDVVIFDEASQVMPADAVPSIVRAARTVVAGDERQLPPTNFFASASPEEDEAEVAEAEDGALQVALTSGFESVLDVLSSLLPWRALTWHYRSRDERLIAFSNEHIYDRSLVTFPGIAGETCLTHIHVPQQPGDGGGDGSAGAEVRRVAQLVIEHAETRPDESLGVITMGIKHRNSIDDEVRRLLADRRDLDEFFDEAQDERFFVKNLERVQGDERDAIILSIGYGKSPDGRMQYRWGPLNMKGGERRLNVAVTRAKSRLTLVSSFTALDVDPNAIKAEGAKLLRGYLEFVASGGANLGTGLGSSPELNPFEINVRDRLQAAGVPLVAQFGVSGYRIDFAAAHPQRPGQMVLAIEADGASYHSSQTARDRDRLRQQHLENLGWTFHRIWSTDWFRDPDTEIARARLAYDRAVAAADLGEPIRKPAPAVEAVADGATPTRGPRPMIRAGQPITEYTPLELRAIVKWIKSDGLLRTDEQIMTEAVAAMGYNRRGSRIKAALERAIAAER